jgi:glycerate 2-kinase
MTPHERKEIILDIFKASLRAVDPAESVNQFMPHVLDVYRQKELKEVIVAGFGKASVPMGKAVIESLPGDIPVQGIIVTKYGHAKDETFPASIEIVEAGHPIPDEAGTRATQRIIELLGKANENTLVLYLISGGGSALLCGPQKGVSLSDKQVVTDLLLKAGATIDEFNVVRKHLSRVKGGQLAKAIYPAYGISLILSDVIGDKLDIIASGPTAPDPSTYDDALGLLRRYNLIEKVPSKIVEILKDGSSGLIPDTPKKGDPAFGNIENLIIGNNQKATQAAQQKAIEHGFIAVAPASNVQGEARVIGERLAAAVISTHKRLEVPGRQRMCFIYGGETTVTVKGDGTGGRNTELALSVALNIAGMQGVTFLSAGTDGTDGPTDAAGAIVDGETTPNARAKGLNPEEYLERNDSYTFFKETGELLVTGPTGTNVMDLYISLIEPSQ